MKAIIKAVLQAGLIIELDGRRGFVPRRELSWDDRSLSPEDHYEMEQETEVVPYGAPIAEQPRFSVKRATYDPWEKHSDKYLAAIQTGDFPVVRGIVDDVTPTCVFIVLEDFNDAVLTWDHVFPRDTSRREKDLTKWFSLGDHVEGRLIEIRADQKRLVLDIAVHLERLALEFRKEDTGTKAWAGTLGSQFPQLEAAELFRSFGSNPIAQDLARLRILGVEDLARDRGKLAAILSEFQCSYELPRTKEEFQASLAQEGYFDVVIMDKNLGRWQKALRGNSLVREIRRHHPGVPIAVFSAEGLDATQEVFIDLPEVDVYSKPYTVEIVDHVLRKAAGLIKISSLGAMRKMDQSAKGIKDYLSADTSTQQKLVGVLRSLCHAARDELRAAILHMDTVAQEVECVCSYGLREMPWAVYKTTLRHTPISDVVLYEEPVFASNLPESRKKHFPAELNFTSFAGLPIETFGETTHGLFLFGSAPESITEQTYWTAHNMAHVIARLLERSLMDGALMQEALFSSMGRLYMSMGHEIRDAVTGVDEVPGSIRTRIDMLVTGVDGSDRNIIIKEILTALNALEKSGRRIQELFDFYADLSRQEKFVKPFHVKTLLEDVVGEMKKRHCKGTIFRVEADDPLVLVNSSTKCKQIIRNLLLNASQQMDEHDSPVSRVYVRAFVDDSSKLPVKISVRDTGPGIHTKDWEKIFEPFQSTRKKGAGLGLYLCRLLARSMGGRISVLESFRFVGTTFLLELPHVQDQKT